MGVVDAAVVVPLLDRNLAGDQNRRALMAIFEDFELRKGPLS